MDRPYSQLTLDGRDERWTLEERASEGVKNVGQLLGVGELVVHAEDCDVLFSCTLLALDKACRSVNADNEASGDFRIERAGVARLLDAEDASDPRDHFVRRGIGGFVEVDHAARDVRFEIALQGRASVRDGCEMR